MNERCHTCGGAVGTQTTPDWTPIVWCKCAIKRPSNKIRRLRARLAGRGATIRRLLEDREFLRRQLESAARKREPF